MDWTPLPVRAPLEAYVAQAGTVAGGMAGW